MLLAIWLFVQALFGGLGQEWMSPAGPMSDSGHEMDPNG